MDPTELDRQLRALDEGRGALALGGFRFLEVSGADAEGWLQDLVTADVEGLEAGEAVRSLLLGPTGRIRADAHVLRTAEAFLLVQALDQPAPIGDLLAPYVLSSDVVLREAPAPGLVAVPALRAWRFDPEGTPGLEAVTAEAVEAWRIRRGMARFPVDLDEDSLPAEAGLDDGRVIDREKGCFLGQESVAKVRNVGHPTRVVLSLEADGAVHAGAPMLAGDEVVGLVTSADATESPSAVFGRVRWDAREADLRTDLGTPLRRR